MPRATSRPAGPRVPRRSASPGPALPAARIVSGLPWRAPSVSSSRHDRQAGADSVTASLAGAILLVGGQGSRLRPLTLTTPKPLLPAGGVPFLFHPLSALGAAGIQRAVLATAYRAELFRHA